MFPPTAFTLGFFLSGVDIIPGLFVFRKLQSDAVKLESEKERKRERKREREEERKKGTRRQLWSWP